MASVSLDYSEYELLKDALEEKTRKIKSLEDIQRVVIKHTDFKIFKEQLADFIENAKRWNNNHAVLELIKTAGKFMLLLVKSISLSCRPNFSASAQYQL